MINILFRNVCVEILALDEAQEELVDNLNVRPGNFQNRFILFRIKCFALRGHRWGNRSKQVLGKHLHHARIHGLCDHGAVVGDVIQELVKSQPLDLFGLHVCCRIIEVEDNVALIDLLHKQFLAPVRSYFVEAWQFLQLSLALVGNVESRRVLTLGGPNPFRQVLRGGLKAIENMGFPWGREVSGHGLGSSRGGSMLRERGE